MRRFPLAVCSFLLLGLVVSGLWATRATKQQEAEQIVEKQNSGVVPGLTMEDMAKGSARIVAGQCTGTSSKWVDRTLYTIATISVRDTMKGEVSPEVWVAVPGGADANRRIPVAMTFPGAPVIQREEEVVLFLKEAEALPGSYMVMGYSQGKLSIVEDEQGGEKFVTRNPARVRMNSGTGVVRGNVQMTRFSEFKEQIRKYLQ